MSHHDQSGLWPGRTVPLIMESSVASVDGGAVDPFHKPGIGYKVRYPFTPVNLRRRAYT